MSRKVLRGLASTLAAIGAVLIACSGAGAATITVETTADTGLSPDQTCSLREAVQVANTNHADGADPNPGGYFPANGDLGCGSGDSGADTIILQPGATYRLTNAEQPLPGPGDETNIRGDLDVYEATTIKANGGLATIAGVPAPNAFLLRDRVIQGVFPLGSVTLQNLRIEDGLNARTGSPGGGGILAAAPLTVIDSEITGNAVGPGDSNIYGGGIFLTGSNASLNMTGSTVAGNTATAAGGYVASGGGIAAYNNAASVTITNSTISGNVVNGAASADGQMGALLSGDSGTPTPATLTNVTITGNSVNGPGHWGGAFLSEGTITGSILANNGDASGLSPDCGGGAASGGGNLIGTVGTSGDCAFGAPGDLVGPAGAPIGPNLGALGDNGGLTRTIAPNPGSPAINRGGSCPVTDQRGFLRSVAPPCDAGAFEVGAALSPPGSTAATPAAATGQRAAALRKCKKKKRKARKRCKRKAKKLPA